MRTLSAVATAIIVISSTPVRADQPFGWVGNGHPSAYVLPMGALELSGSLLRVNDTLDVFGLRNRLLEGNQQLIGNTGDLDGNANELRLGVWESLEVFYRHADQDLTANLAPISSADINNLDSALRTRTEEYGAKWVFYQALNQDRSQPWVSAALELTKNNSQSNDFGGDLAALRTSASGGVRFDPPSRFALDRLQDEGWRARFLFNRAFSPAVTMTAWAGYGETQATAGTRWDVDISFLREAFSQSFDTRESQFALGAGVNWQYSPRLPIQLGYEYINITKRDQNITRGSAAFSRFLPSFLRGERLAESETSNHALYGSMSWWVTPNLYLGLTGRLFSNQFTGVLPHYNNPLSGSFSDIAYGYLQLKLGVRFAAKRN